MTRPAINLTHTKVTVHDAQTRNDGLRDVEALHASQPERAILPWWLDRYLPMRANVLATAAAVADPTRLHLVSVLLGRERTVGQLAEAVAVSTATICHHLPKLVACGLVTARRRGRYTVVRAVAGRCRRVLAALSEGGTDP